MLTIQYGRRYRSCISVKILVFASVEQNVGSVWRVGVRRKRGMNNTSGQRGFMINSEVQNSRKVCPGGILRQVRKGFTV